MIKILNTKYSDSQFLTVAGMVVLLLMGWLVVRYDEQIKEARVWEIEYKKDVATILFHEKDSMKRKEIINSLKK